MEILMTYSPKVSVVELLDAGIHFGHKTSRWNPKMAPYIYGVKDGIHIIDLQQTVPLMEIALKKIYETVRNNGKVLFVGSKVQATDLIAEYAEKCGQFYINHRWLGGMLTNWGTISRSIKKLDNIEKVLEDEDTFATYTKKEILDLSRKRDKLLKLFSGIRKIGGRPDIIVVIDTNKEHLAISEAVKLGINVIAIVDSNSNPDNIDFPIPGNDDAIRSIRLFCNAFAEAALTGIKDALAESGIDVGAAASESEDKSLEGVEKLAKTAKVSKAKPVVVTTKKAEAKKAESNEEEPKAKAKPKA
jgi:small subunit ribosomal protein S2